MFLKREIKTNQEKDKKAREKPSKTGNDKKKVVLFVSPHPDDIEFWAFDFCYQAVKAGWEVHQLLATCDEYGTPRNDFKGQRIQRIRRHEMQEAAKVYGIDPATNKPLVKLHWADYIDCFVPFNKHSVERFKKFFRKIHPDIILGPDPFLYLDAHRDHIATGLNYYFALKNLNKEERPKLMLYFQTTSPDFFIADHKYLIPSKNLKKNKNRAGSQSHQTSKDLYKVALLKHRSQFDAKLIILGKILPFLASIPKYLKLFHLRKIYGFRRVSFNQSKAKDMKGWGYFVFRFITRDLEFGPTKDLTKPGPKELGLNTNPVEEIK
ncbi:MAG: PIG-L deacetylase family protein [Promethearchaeota archaeon]